MSYSLISLALLFYLSACNVPNLGRASSLPQSAPQTEPSGRSGPRNNNRPDDPEITHKFTFADLEKAVRADDAVAVSAICKKQPELGAQSTPMNIFSTATLYEAAQAAIALVDDCDLPTDRDSDNRSLLQQFLLSLVLKSLSQKSIATLEPVALKLIDKLSAQDIEPSKKKKSERKQLPKTIFQKYFLIMNMCLSSTKAALPRPRLNKTSLNLFLWPATVKLSSEKI